MISDEVEDIEDPESDEEQLQRPAFDILEDVSNYRVEDVPVNGHQFLKKVRAEAATCPKVKVAELNDKLRRSKQNFFVKEDETIEIPPSYLPSHKWQMQQIEDFDRVRGEVGQLRETNDEFLHPSFAPEKSVEQWYEYFHDVERPEPKVSQILRLNQPTLDTILYCFTRWLDEGLVTFDSFTCCWIYAILACLEIPLMPDTYHNLRMLAVQAAKARCSIANVEDETLTRVNLFICLVGRYFRQVDLADKFVDFTGLKI